MPRREIAAYEGANLPRPNPWTPMPEPVRVKKHPKFVHGKVGSAMLLHKVQYVEARWYAYGMHEFIRLQLHRWLLARFAVHGSTLRQAVRVSANYQPPDAVICGMCSGKGRIFGRNGSNHATKRQAKDRLSCVAEGTQV